MSLIYVDTSAPTDGTGSATNPRNTCAGVSLMPGDSLLLRAGTVVPAEHTSSIALPDGATIGYYGTGAKPIISGAETRSDFVQYAPGILSRHYPLGNIGNVRTISGQHLQFWQVASPSLLTAGQYTYIAADNALYVCGDDGAYIVAETRFGIYSTSSASGVSVDGIEISSVSTHGIVLHGKRNLEISSVDLKSIGGYWSQAGGYFYGNGIELSAGVVVAEVTDCTAQDVFDSAFTAQAYSSGGSLGMCSDIVFSGLSASRCGMSAFEASVHNTNQFVSVLFEDSTANNIGVGCYSGNRTGAVCLISRSQNYRESTNSVFAEFVGITASNAQKYMFSKMPAPVYCDITGENMLTEHFGISCGSVIIDGVQRANHPMSTAVRPSRAEFC